MHFALFVHGTTKEKEKAMTVVFMVEESVVDLLTDVFCVMYPYVTPPLLIGVSHVSSVGIRIKI